MEFDLRSSVRLSVFGALVAVVVAGCAGATGPPTAKTIVNPGNSVAQLAVGTVNLYGGTTYAMTGMNVTSTLRTPDGKSVLVNTPYITGPFKLPAYSGVVADGSGSTIELGPTPTEVAAESITATPQVPPGTVTIPPSTFGVSGGDFANGFQPSNADNVGGFFLSPYVEPLYDVFNVAPTSSMPPDPNVFSAWGGPPAFDPNHNGQGTRDGTFGPGLLGVVEGVNVFMGVTVNPGVYSLRVVIPTINQNYQVSGQFTLPGVATLGNATAPAYHPNGSGGGTFSVTMPSGATDGLLNIVDLGPPLSSGGGQGGSCNGSSAGGPSYYTLHVTTSGTYTLPDTDGPGNPTHRHPTICTAAQNSSAGAADVISVQLIGADYPLYANQYLFNLGQQSPSIVGSSGSNDLTISAVGNGTVAGAAPRGHRPLNMYLQRLLRERHALR